MIVINSTKEMEKYYNSKTNTYEFVGSTGRQDVKFTFDLRIKSNIYAGNINAEDIKAWDINAWNINAGNINAWNIDAGDIDAGDINAGNINAGYINAGYINAGYIDAGYIDAGDINAEDIDAEDISYYAVCVSYQNIKCKSITGKRENAKHICLDGKLTLKEDSEC